MRAHQRAGAILFVVFWSLFSIAILRESDPMACAGLGVLAVLFGAMFVMD